MICIVVLMGLPGVGKTHFSKYLIDNLSLENTKISYISYDEQEKCMEKTVYKNFRCNVYKKVDDLLQNLSSSKDDEVVMIDDNMFYRSMRRSFYNLAKKYITGFCEIFVDCSLDLALERNHNRLDRVPESVISEMFQKFEKPSINNYWEKYFVTINSEKDFVEKDLQTVRDLIKNAIDDPVQEEEQFEIIPEPLNRNQTYDLTLRKLVGRKLKAVILANKPQLTIEALAKELLIKKKYILDGIKNKELFLRDHDDDEELEKIMDEFLENAEIPEEDIPSKRPRLSYDNGNDISEENL